MTTVYLDLPENYFSIENLDVWLKNNSIPAKIVYTRPDVPMINYGWKIRFNDPEYATLFQLKWNYHGQ